MTSFLHTMAVVSAEHHRPELCDKRPGMCQASNNFFRNHTAIIDRQIGEVPCWARSANGLGDSIDHLLLRQGMVIGDVIDVAWGMLMVSCQQETLDYVGDITKWQRILSASKNHTLAIFHLLGHASKM